LSCDEKNDYYERWPLLVEIPEISEVINGNKLNLSYGVRSPTIKKNLKIYEKFKVFIGFKNTCLFCIYSTDGLKKIFV
jgi:hypothetical protein